MTLIWNIIQSVITILEIRVCVWMMEKFAEPRYSGKKQKIVVWIVTLGVGVFYAYNRWGSAYYSRIVIISVLIIFCVTIFWMFRYYRIIAIFFVSNYLLVGGLLDLMVMGIAEIANQESQVLIHIEYENDLYRIGVMLLSKSILFMGCLIIQKKINKKVIQQLKGKKISITCILLCIVEYMGLHVLTTILNSALHISHNLFVGLLFYVIMIFLMIIIMGITILYYDKKEELKQKSIFLESLNYENQRMIKLYREREIMYHDFKNHLLALDGIIQCGDMKEYQAYMERIREPFLQKPIEWRTGHSIMDLILNYKVREARNKKIQVKCSVFGYMNFDLQITDEEVCSLVGNLWDNAIEACERLKQNEEVWIEFLLQIRPEKLLMEISNPYREIVTDKRGKLQTTKVSKGIHGIGVRTIKDITERYGGYFRYELYDHVFSVEVMICNK